MKWVNLVCIEYVSKSLTFATDLDEILSDIIPQMKKAQPKRPPTIDNLYDFFISRARNNLHIALCFSPVSYLKSVLAFKGNSQIFIFRLEKNSDYVP